MNVLIAFSGFVIVAWSLFFVAIGVINKYLFSNIIIFQEKCPKAKKDKTKVKRLFHRLGT